MAKVKLYGVQELNFDADDGKHVEGIKLHFGAFNKHVYGEKVDTKFFDVPACDRLGLNYSDLCSWVGKEIDFDLDFSREIVGIRLVD